MNIILAIVVMVLATQLTRFLPFIIYRDREPSKKLKQAARLIPGAVMMTLVLTSLPISLEKSSLLQWIGVIIVALLHLSFNKPLISILGGTAIYITLLNIL